MLRVKELQRYSRSFQEAADMAPDPLSKRELEAQAWNYVEEARALRRSSLNR